MCPYTCPETKKPKQEAMAPHHISNKGKIKRNKSFLIRRKIKLKGVKLIKFRSKKKILLNRTTSYISTASTSRKSIVRAKPKY
jgi:hypothetical protein